MAINQTNQDHNCPSCAAIQQALLSFTGRVDKAHDFEEFKKANQQLYKNIKRVKIHGELESE